MTQLDSKTIENSSDQKSKKDRKKIRYIDVIKGQAPVPSDKYGFFFFQALMVLGMVSVMVTFNGVRSDGLSFLINSHWVYPCVLLAAFVWRRTVANAITSRLIPRLVAPHLHGTAAAVAKSVINVGSMNPLVSFFVGLLVKGPSGAVAFWLAAQPLSLIVAILVNFFVVGPFVKTIVNNHTDATTGPRMVARLHGILRPVATMFGLS